MLFCCLSLASVQLRGMEAEAAQAPSEIDGGVSVRVVRVTHSGP